VDRLTATGEDKAAETRLLRWAVELTAWIGSALKTEREPEGDAVLRRELPNLRAAWRLARHRGALDDAAGMVLALYDAIAYRDLVEIRDWAAELAADPAIASHPSAADILGVAAEAIYHRGDYRHADRLARAGLEKAADSGSWHCLSALSVADLARCAFGEVVEHSLAAAALAGPHRENLGVAALAKAYAGDVEAARELNDQGRAAAVAPTLQSFGAYVAGEIEGCAGDTEAAETHYVRAIELARGSGATFVVGVATVGLLSVQGAAGRVHEALSGYRDVIEYFARTGNWTHLWTTLRNLADLLRRLGDEEPAVLIDAAAGRAPDAPAVGGDDSPPPSGVPVLSRAAVLETARQAIERNLTRS
jgi:tetratricopeptide (TPR) repeat protein